jgi:hypothetical protein
MKTLLTFTLLLLSNLCFAQIEISEAPAKKEIQAIPYKGEFMSFDGIYDEAKKKGVVGEQVTLLDISTYNIYASKEDLKSYKNISYKEKDKFTNKTFEVIAYEHDIYDILTIKNDSGQYIWKVQSGNKYIFNKFLETTKSNLEGKTFIPLHASSEFQFLDGSEVTIEGDKKYTVTKVKFSKLEYDYEIVLEINGQYESILPLDTYEQPRLFNGKIYTSNPKYINIASDEIKFPKVTLIEEAEFEKFKTKHTDFIDKIRAREVVLGMSKKECIWAWGRASRKLNDLVGYDTVLIYDARYSLYFSEDVLVVIH